MDRGSARSGFMLFAVLALVLVGILAYIMLSRLNHIDQEVSQLRTQVQQSNMKADVASTKAANALDQASAAAQNALEACAWTNRAADRPTCCCSRSIMRESLKSCERQ